MPVTTIDALAEALPRMALVNAYGATETTSPTTMMPAGQTRAHADTVGVALPCAEIVVMDDAGREVDAGDDRRALDRRADGRSRLLGQRRRRPPRRSRAGFWHSGDLGSVDGEGYVRIFDRKKDMLNRGGFKVYSVEVENALMGYPGIVEAAIIARPCPVLGERVHAFVHAPGIARDDAALRAHCAARLADYKVPETITWSETPLPRNANGKLMKRLLRDTMLAADAGSSSPAPEDPTMTDATDLADRSAVELLRLYRSGAASPVEATRAVLARIERFNPALNAFCHVAAEDALAAARASEARWKQQTPCGALDGVPVSIKDLILVRGMPTLRGSRTIDPAQPWDVDAPVAARLREAGAVILGKTATPEFGCKGETNSPLTGITRNPWNPERTPGGSSGGTAAAIAAGMGPLSVGTDGAGSVRIPAAFCGNFGLKPSFGRVPAYPLSPFGSVAHLGPHAMSVADAALMMNVIKQPDARDWTSLPPDPSDYTPRPRRRHPRPAHRLVADARLRQERPPRSRRSGRCARWRVSRRSAPMSSASIPASTIRSTSRPGSGSPAPGRSGTASARRSRTSSTPTFAPRPCSARS